MVSIIVAIGANRVIGNNNALLWHITEDMRYFRSVTSGHAVVMGRKTYDSIGRPLPKRHNVVVTRQDIDIEGCSVVHSLEEALSLLPAEDEIFIIGGAEIYALALPFASRLYITIVGGEFVGDTHFPEWESMGWTLLKSEKFERGVEFEHPFSFDLYER
ncbi:MAG: dihydrofolate reductase [Rikenellaceae bacterium]